MVIQHSHKDQRGLFFIEDEGEVLAEMTYSLSQPDQMIIEHTEVDEEYRGKDIGFHLVNSAVEYARKHRMKIIPVCVFAKAVFDHKPDFQDVLH